MMKTMFISNLIKTILLACLFVPVISSAQSTVDAALQKGNAAELSAYLAKSVDLLILTDESTMSADQATTMLADFFTKSSVKSYKQNHMSTAQNGKSTYSIGDLVTGNGTYRVTIFYDAARKISEIRIEK